MHSDAMYLFGALRLDAMYLFCVLRLDAMYLISPDAIYLIIVVHPDAMYLFSAMHLDASYLECVCVCVLTFKFFLGEINYVTTSLLTLGQTKFVRSCFNKEDNVFKDGIGVYVLRLSGCQV